MKIYFKMLILLILFIAELDAYKIKNCDDIYPTILNQYLEKNIDKTKELLKNCTFSKEYIMDSVNVIKSGILNANKKYKKAIAINELSKKNIIKYYNLRNIQLRNGESKNNIHDIYFTMLSNLGNSYSALGDYNKAIENYSLWIDSAETPNTMILGYIAYNYYSLNQYDKAIEYLKKSYFILKGFEELFEKRSCAYNIAAVYAKINDIKQSIKWLKISFKLHNELHIGKINRDDDFELFREREEFKSFLNSINKDFSRYEAPAS